MEDVMTREEMIKYETDYYVNLVRIKKCQTEHNPELEYQLKVQRNKLHNLGVNTDDYEYDS